MSTQLRESLARNASVAGMTNPVNMLSTKWSKEIGLLNEAFNGKLDEDRKMGTAVLLENTERFLKNSAKARNMFALNEATQPSDTSFFKQFAFNNLLAVYPNLIAPDLVSTQPMLSRAGEIRYMRVLYGSTKGKIKAGDTINSLELAA